MKLKGGEAEGTPNEQNEKLNPSAWMQKQKRHCQCRGGHDPDLNRRRDFREGSNNGISMFDLKRRQVGTVVDCNGMTTVDTEGEDSGESRRMSHLPKGHNSNDRHRRCFPGGGKGQRSWGLEQK